VLFCSGSFWGMSRNRYPDEMRQVFGLLGWMALWVCGSGGAQQVATGQSPTQQVLSQRTLSGVVTDRDGGLIPGALVVLQSDASGKRQSTVTGDDGHFTFDGVAAGRFTLTVTVDNMQGASETGSLNEDESLELPPIVLAMAAMNMNVEVSSLTEQELAEKQLKVEETQRLVGLVPNFYVTYDWKAEALTTKQKFKLAARSLVDPATFVIIGGFAGIEQATNSFSGYGQGAEGYGKRYGAGLADSSIGGMLGGAVLPTLFRQDPRYFYKGTGSTRSRIWYALSRSVIARGDNGKWQPAYAGILGDFGSGAISNLYYPASDRNGAGLTIENGFLDVASDGLGNLLQEFVLKRISPGFRRTGMSNP
jgi:hypothetical protein